MYTCGPTVYSFPSIGNWRTYATSDLLIRTLQYLGYSVDSIMNLTDVGHLTGDNSGDADTGEDRLEKAAKKEGRTAWDIAAFYTENFYTGFDKLNLLKPRLWCKATDHIPEQIAMVQQIMDKGFAYTIADGIYFDTKAYETAGNIYGELSNLAEIKEGARVEINPDKRDARDFALWKLSPAGEKRQMEWESPWGMGFPGWHIECSAMSTKYLGDQFDIHVGGEDLKSTHHPNEIAQAEAATGKKPFVNFWVHCVFLLIDGGRMGKSLGNAYTIEDVEKRGFDPLVIRYFYLTGHYRKQLNFTWEALQAASTALSNLRELVWRSKQGTERTVLSDEKLTQIEQLRQAFGAALENDLNIPEALAVVWEVAKSNIPGRDKAELIESFDEVLGLRLSTWEPEVIEIPQQVTELVTQRDLARKAKDFAKSDALRLEIQLLGFDVQDNQSGPIITKI